MIVQSPRGTADWYGDKMREREIIEKICSETAALYDIHKIATPVFEYTELFSRGVGETTDVVQKEMYTFEDKGGRSISLKPEGTAGVIRAYLEHSMYAKSPLTKLYYITPAFRYEKPQSGRLRQHHQFGVEYIGSELPLVEAELISIADSIIRKLGLKDLEVHINSIGCAACRKKYNEALLDFLRSKEDGLCPVCRERMTKNPLRVLDCKEESCREIVKDAPKTLDYLDEECGDHFERLKSLLDELNIKYVVDPGIVRGLDYYTRTVFEFVNKDGLTLCGGGRYDSLVREIDGKQDIPAAGFGMGLERILYFLGLSGIELSKPVPPTLYIGTFPDTESEGLKLAVKLRGEGIITETDFLARSVKAQMKYANKLGALYVVILGSDEIKNGKVMLKNMAAGTEEECPVSELSNIIKEKQR